MTESRDNEPSLDPGLPTGDAAPLAELARRLEEERPLPLPGFRASLRRKLLHAHGQRTVERGRLRIQVAAYASSGIALLLIAALGVSGVGPLAAG